MIHRLARYRRRAGLTVIGKFELLIYFMAGCFSHLVFSPGRRINFLVILWEILICLRGNQFYPCELGLEILKTYV